MQEMLLGLIGYPLGHSRSPGIYDRFFSREGIAGGEYRLFPMASVSDLHTLLADHPTLTGFNVTIPHKEAILPLLDELDETAAAVGAVNTVTVARISGRLRLRGYNTDAPGFLATVQRLQLRGPALVLGTGGSSRAVTWALKQAGIEFIRVSRNGKANDCLSYHEVDEAGMTSHPLIINTTPLGMHPHAEEAPPIPYHHLTPGHLLFDLVYNPETTNFLHHGLNAGARTLNGMEMLERQAELSFRIFLSARG